MYPGTPIPKTNCPYCLKRLNRAGCPDAIDAPIPGGLVVCMNCSAVAVLNPDLSLRKLTADDLAELSRDRQLMERLSKYVEIVQRIKGRERAMKN